jgi:ABC-2 type transport system ATP-binding protein
MIVAEDLGIQFPVGRRRRMKVRELLTKGRTGAPAEGDKEFWALRKVSFEVQRGEAVGIIGGNGHGKSTLLRLISGVMIPDEGRAWVKGGSTKVAPLIEVTGGFSGELTVRDNIWLAAGLKGLSKRQIAAKFDEIVAFAEISHRLDQPFRHLSSGMKAKVGFSVVTSIDKPIVLVDEVLSVGDRAFKNKCFVRMEEMLGQGKTVLLVSHSAVQVERFCKRGLYLRDGRLIGDGPVSEILTRYGQDADRLAEDDRSALRARRRAARMLRDSEELAEDEALGAPRRRRRTGREQAEAELRRSEDEARRAEAEAEERRRREADLDD